MEKTLHEHFFRSSLSYPGDNTKIEKPLRWKHQVVTKQHYCYFYSESNQSFWSFKWCPRTSVSQGQRNSQMLLDKEISLGSYLDTPSSTKVSEIFQSQLKKLFPAAEVEIYAPGDFCADVNSSRMAAVVLHDESSTFCKDFSLQDYTISKVVEPKTCSYILHACRQRMLHSTDFEESLSYPPNNATVEYIQSMLHSYLHRTQRQDFEASNPDLKTSSQEAMPPLPQSRILSNRKLIKEMFQHAYDSYMYNAYPASEIKPMTCKPAVFNLVRIPALTLIDSLDTLIVLGNYTEFARSVERLRELNDFLAKENGHLGNGGIFALNQNVSVFETTIRILGGLLSAHQLAQIYLQDKVLASDLWDSSGGVLIGNDSTLVCGGHDGDTDAKNVDDPTGFASSIPRCTARLIRQPMCQRRSNIYWEYDGLLLELARDIGDRLLPAFATHTGIPYGTVNLLNGVPLQETTIASLAGGGTLSLEMELLSRLTGNVVYGNAAKLATRALWVRSSQFNTFGKHICTQSGHWTESWSGIGSNSDSFYEYLVKHYFLFPEDQTFWYAALAAYGGVHNESRLGDWYADVDLTRGLSTNGVARQIFEALMAFYPGMQVLLGEILPAARSLNSFFLVREYLGFLPERFDYGNWRVDSGGGSHFLRPELVESAYFLHRATKGLQRQDASSGPLSVSSWQWAADYALQALDKITRCNCGFASLRETAPWTTGAAALGSPTQADLLIDEMPSFFLSETLKYLYLTFDDNNLLHDSEDRDWIFTTEAHPIHYVAEPSMSSLEDQKNILVELLRSRISGKFESKQSKWERLAREKWTRGTTLEAFSEKLHPFVNYAKENSEQQITTAKGALTEPILPVDHVYSGLDVFGETQYGMNDAHLMLRRNGNGVFLKQSCPNFYSSELLYIHALNGGGTDYITSYVSALRDGVNPGESRFLMMGSTDALAWYGSGVHISEAFDPGSFCVINYDDQRPPSTSDHSTSNAEEHREVPPQRFDGGDLGNFEIVAFDGGAGFSIKHIGSGQSLSTTIIHDAGSIQNGETYFMVDHNVPASKETETNIDRQNDTKSLRSVVMTDTRSNSFVCVVSIIETAYLRTDHHSNQRGMDLHTSAAKVMETVIAQYPCAPALFGASHPEALTRKSDIHVEAQLRAPEVGDEKGCKEPTRHLCAANEQRQCEESISMAGSSRIQLVERGSCTFQEKSANQVGAEAVIVINSKENELFVMSGNGDQINTQILDGPLTVLVSGADGVDMIKTVEALSVNRNSVDAIDTANQLICRVSVVREKDTRITNDGSEFAVSGNQFWPAVVASPDAVQMFVEDGWGVHAAQRKSNTEGRATEWQLYLLRHSSGQDRDHEEEETA